MSKSGTSPSSIAISITPGMKDIFLFKISNTFLCRFGAVRIAVSLALLAAAVLLRGILPEPLLWLLFALGLLNPVATPLIQAVQASRQAASMRPMIFVFLGENITVNDGKNRNQAHWSKLHKIVWSKRFLLLHLDSRTAFVIPKAQIKDKLPELEALVRANSHLCRTIYRKTF